MAAESAQSLAEGWFTLSAKVAAINTIDTSLAPRQRLHH